ncbi:MAG: 4-(cytidine 5'-diphospho)-2-C-methyl-D-erythritol kinase [Planctomycetota bacterium]|jgi:4-diphosphocytidyl-2-C-methyl-D-erythritol kinase|nr:4-(cytidine 5'-diphospho)-2-C-methyl-D-erythritol kinase [Planctomycetota bacterium]
MSITARVYPKINLFLEIVRRRADGYHEIATVMQTVGNVYDELAVEPADTFSLTVRGAETRGAKTLSVETHRADLPTDDRNLVLRAARALRLAVRGANVIGGARFTLTKNIPTGAGLGGGSADAAAALQLCAQLWRLDIAPAEMSAVAATVGSDVPFFLTAATAPVALATGRGEIITPIAADCSSPTADCPPPTAYCNPLPCNLILPPWSSATGAAYRALSAADFDRHPITDFLPIWATGDAAKILAASFNVFARSFFQREKRAARLAAFLAAAGFPAQLSGSGAAMWMPQIGAAARAELQRRLNAAPELRGTRIV